MLINEDNYLAHYGILRRSGRYPWGSGANPAQRSKSFLDHIALLREQGLSDPEIARGFSTKETPFTTTDLRALTTIARNQKKIADIARATQLKDKGLSNVAIGEKMGINESSVRSLLKESQFEKTSILTNTSNMLRDQVDTKGYIDIGTGVENHLGISSTMLNTAVSTLKAEGYVVQKVQVDQLGTNNKTTVKVLCPPGTTYRDVVTNRAAIRQITERTENHGRSYFGLLPPVSVDSKRVAVNYAEDGGSDADGVIFVRPGIDDISLGGSRYAQVRIAVDGTHYLKGMAIYKDDLPDGVDLVFNTNKAKADIGSDKLAAMKPMKDDPDNPFGAVVSQLGERDASGNLTKVTSAMNIVNEEGSWGEWKKSISSQVLSKQSPILAKTQLDMTFERKKQELDEIMALTNPAVRKKLLESYADDVDSSAVHLKAAALPRQASQVILPVNTLKDTEIYAPNFRDGERVALIRYPHGGTFEIPELTVNNKHPDAKKLLGQAVDAVGINSTVASRLSGADFDGDSVLVIPNPASNPKIKTQPALEGLRNFDPQRDYKAAEGMEFKGNKQQLMGDVSNLITDMTIKGANANELAAAVRHSMVVIDAEKHNLDYKRSSVENGIPNLKRKYQGSASAGASTLVSRATSRQDVLDRKPRSAAKGGPIDKATGRKVYEETGESYVNKDGKVVFKTQRSTKLAEADDAYTLSSGTPIENVYASHSNKLKSLANTARKEAVNTTTVPYSPSAKKAYDTEVKQLDAKLNLALRNRPLERQAQLLANATVEMKRQATPDMDRTMRKKVESQALEEARRRTGAKKQLVEITDREWDAIQAGAITNNKLTQILANSNLDRVKALATPRTQLLMSSTKTARAKQMAASGYTQSEIADALGVSLTTLKEGLK